MEHNIAIKAHKLAEVLEPSIIAEILFNTTLRMLVYYNRVIVSDQTVKDAIQLYLSYLHGHLHSLGMRSFLQTAIPSRVEIQCISVMYLQGELDSDPISFTGISTFSHLVENYPSLMLDLFIVMTRECLRGIQLRLGTPMSNYAMFLQKAKAIRRRILESTEISPLAEVQSGIPTAMLRVKIT